MPDLTPDAQADLDRRIVDAVDVPDLTLEHLHILQHALGLDEHGRNSAGDLCPDETYRRHFVTDEECDNWEPCQALVAAGLMEQRRVCGGPAFLVTPAGRAYVREHSPPPPKVSRGRRRYLAWLQVREVDADLTFREFLRRGAEVERA